MEDLGPKFSGNEEAVVGGVVGDSVEYVHGGDAVGEGEQAGEIDVAFDLACGGVDADD